MGKHELNPEQLYRKQKKKQAYENKERERQKTRKEMSKKLDRDKIQARIHAIEKEEAAGRMTIGMRQEKSNLTMQLKSITKTSSHNNKSFQKRVPINDPSKLDGQQIKESTPSATPVTPPLPPPLPTEETSQAPPPPPPSVPIYNPMARRSVPVAVTGMEVNPSLVPKAAKKPVAPPPPPPVANPFASSLPTAPEKQEEEDMLVPGPKLRFSLFSYANEESEEEEPKEEENDEEFAKFMQDIANMSFNCSNKQCVNNKAYLLLTNLNKS